jgi:hypothetical protein
MRRCALVKQGEGQLEGYGREVMGEKCEMTKERQGASEGIHARTRTRARARARNRNRNRNRRWRSEERYKLPQNSTVVRDNVGSAQT